MVLARPREATESERERESAAAAAARERAAEEANATRELSLRRCNPPIRQSSRTNEWMHD